ncbi:MAG: hypothetical protein IKI97_04710 [Clostridia bacterium]|nr:hypothetical protein [Clostridia bacterium]
MANQNDNDSAYWEDILAYARCRKATYRIEDISRTKYIYQIPSGIYIAEKSRTIVMQT